MPANQVRMDDGFSTIITLANIPTVKLFEKEVTPPGMELGGAIDTTTMRNIEWRTMAPRKLKTLTQVSAVVAYATEAIEQLWAQIGKVQRIQVSYPDESSITFWGWLESFTPASHKEGEQPTASIVVQTGNRNPAGAETAPLYDNGGGSLSSNG